MEEGSTSQNGGNPDHFIFPVGDFWVGKDGKWRVLRNGSLSLIPNINHSSISDSQRPAPTHSHPEEYRVCMNRQSIMNPFHDAPGPSQTNKNSSFNSVSKRAGPSCDPTDHAPEGSGSMATFLKSPSNRQNISEDNISIARVLESSLPPEALMAQMKHIIKLDSLEFKGSKVKYIFSNRLYLYFQTFVDSLEDNDLNEVIPMILSESQLFLDAAIFRDGSKAIVNMIKKTAHSDLASAVTKVLSTRFYDIMIDPNARLVILQCLDSFGDDANEILYEQLMIQYRDLAIHEVGNISLKDFIAKISGNRRMDLLNAIADNSDCLSNDRYGNYVVQHVIELENDTVATRILIRLKGHFVSLSQKKYGCYVVQKLMETSEHGADVVALELLENHYWLVRVACDAHGNYVIQSALDKTTKDVHASLVKALKRYVPQLVQSPSGQYVLNELRRYDPNNFQF